MKKINPLYFSLILILLAGTIVSFLLFLHSNKDNENNLLQNTNLSIVEIKALSEDVGESYGTAIFVKNDGTLVTNAHIVTYKQLNEYHTFDNISIRFSFDENYHKVSLLKYDIDKDLAVLKIDDKNIRYEAIEFGKSSEIKAGNEVFAIGNLNNVGISITKGIISNPKINVEYNNCTRCVIQCDLTIADGNSGGALLNRDGKLIGITSFRLKDNSGNVIYGISYCIPTDVVLEYIK